MNEPIHILSLGAGVQSSTMALMAACGEITPMPKCAIFADTQAEPQSVYRWLDWLEKQLPFPVHRVSKGSLETETLVVRTSRGGNSYTNSNVPVFLKTAGVEREGRSMRQCTADFKIGPITREVRRIAATQISQWRKSKKTYEPPVIQWIGISRDEILRMKPSRLDYIVHRWPLIDSIMSRQKCIEWMKKKGFPEPPRSACVFCPYHSDKEWLRLKNDEPEAFARAVEFEGNYQFVLSKIQRRQAVPFLHRSCIPLSQVEFKSTAAQESDFFNNECEGMCGV